MISLRKFRLAVFATILGLVAIPAFSTATAKSFGIQSYVRQAQLDDVRTEIAGNSVKIWGLITYSNSCVASANHYAIAQEVSADQLNLIVFHASWPGDINLICTAEYMPVQVEIEIAEMYYSPTITYTVNGLILKL